MKYSASNREYLRASPQWRQHDRKNEYAVVEVFAKGSLADLLFEIAMRGDHYSHVDSERLVSTYPFDFAFF